MTLATNGRRNRGAAAAAAAAVPRCGWRRAAALAAAGALALGQRGALADVCVLSSGLTEVTIGEPTAVCLVLNGLEWQAIEGEATFYSQVLILPDADEFSRFSVQGSWNSSRMVDNEPVEDPLLETFGTDVGVHVESMGKFSYQKAFRIQGDSKTFPLHTAVIAVDQGEVTGITWDDGCHFCGSSQCEQNTYRYSGELIEGDGAGMDCYWPDSDCINDSTEGQVSSLCQLTVYVVWTGTDSNGNYFTSFSKRLSMYAGETVDNLIDRAADKYEATLEAN